MISQLDKKLNELCITDVLAHKLKPNGIELLTVVKLEVLKLTVIYVRVQKLVSIHLDFCLVSHVLARLNSHDVGPMMT